MSDAERIIDLKNKKRAVILAHYYTLPEVQQVADFVGDSLALSEKAAATDADIILFAGVYFMAETAKILSPSKKVLIPDPEAGCSLAESCPADEFAAFRAAHPGATVVSYVNTTADIKALTDICCTSSNALDVIRSIPEGKQIIFAPDRNLGSYLRRQTGRTEMILWNGACHVHEDFSLQGVLDLKKQHPGAPVLSHPECPESIISVSYFVGSTAAILSFAGSSPADKFIVVTEAGILYEMRKTYPHKTFIAAPPKDPTLTCNECPYMKLVTLPKILAALETERPEVTIDEATRSAAENSIRTMLQLNR
jgi:quinolinate synthase